MGVIIGAKLTRIGVEISITKIPECRHARRALESLSTDCEDDGTDAHVEVSIQMVGFHF